MFRMKTNESYSLIVDLYNRDYKTWQRQQTYVNGRGMWVENNSTTKYQYSYGSGNTLYYTKTLIKFKKTLSSAPIFVYFTVHFDDNGGDMNTYPKEFKNQVYIVAYGIKGLSDHVDPEVYDAHEAFEIDKTKMKMLVSLDMNGKQLMNVNYDLKFNDLFKIKRCYFSINPKDKKYYLYQTSNNNILSLVKLFVMHALIIYRTIIFDETTVLFDNNNLELSQIHIRRFPHSYHKTRNKIYITMLFFLDEGLNYIKLRKYSGQNFNTDIFISYI